MSATVQPELLGRSTTHLERDVYLARLKHLSDWPAELAEPKPHFVVFLAMDATEASSEEIANAARKLLSQGMVYVCVWGPDCERVHDTFDRVAVETGHIDDATLMSSWHSDEDLEDALWSSLFTAVPGDAFIDSCKALVAVVVGKMNWADDIAAALSDVDQFNHRVLAREGD